MNTTTVKKLLANPHYKLGPTGKKKNKDTNNIVFGKLPIHPTTYELHETWLERKARRLKDENT